MHRPTRTLTHAHSLAHKRTCTHHPCHTNTLNLQCTAQEHKHTHLCKICNYYGLSLSLSLSSIHKHAHTHSTLLSSPLNLWPPCHSFSLSLSLSLSTQIYELYLNWKMDSFNPPEKQKMGRNCSSLKVSETLLQSESFWAEMERIEKLCQAN